MLLQIFRHVLSLVAASSCKSGGGMLLQKLLTSGGMVLQTGTLRSSPAPLVRAL
jgi:hypothetical protein